MTVCVYTSGRGSGHIARINAVWKGFRVAGIQCARFFAIAPVTRYAHLLAPGIERLRWRDLPGEMDAFVCDWRSEAFIDQLTPDRAKAWVGLRRLGSYGAFPPYFHTIAIEPEVEADECLWPLIFTYENELLDREQAARLLGLPTDQPLRIACENGLSDEDLRRVLGEDARVLRCSNNPDAGSNRHDIYPIAPLFRAADRLVVGAGYNSFHEALSYARHDRVTLIEVDAEDQDIRRERFHIWERGRGSRAHEIARRIAELADG